MINRSKILAFSSVILLSCGLLLAAISNSYNARSSIDADVNSLPKVAIVFTGQFDRIELALGFLKTGAIKKLFISGLNPPAGLSFSTFQERFGVQVTPWTVSPDAKVIAGTQAQTTLGNAIESICWLDHYSNTSEITLITSQIHMARASLALERAALGKLLITRFPVIESEGADHSSLLREQAKFALTWLVTLLPRQHWPDYNDIQCPSVKK